MIKVRRSSERGYEDKGWLQTYHTFSFDTYYDTKFMGYHVLRVLNEDRLKGGKGFGMHTHKDMEIVTYVLEGALEHKDSLGHVGVIREGELQRMTAGTGIAHSESNLSHFEEVHFLQIWILPENHGLTPSYEQKVFASAAKWGQWCLLVSRNGRSGSLRIHQDCDIYSTILEKGEEMRFEALVGRYYWIQIISGKFLILREILEKGDGCAIEEESLIQIKSEEGGELLLFDLGI